MVQKRIITKYIVLISVVFLVFLIGRIYYDSIHQKDMLENRLSNLHTNIRDNVEISKKTLIEKYQMLNAHFMHSQKVYEYFKYDKREKLHKLLKEDYEEFKKIDPNLFVMHFIDKNNITVLRMHKPESFDDDLTKKRPIVAYANKTAQSQTGFEVGKNGIVYRITSAFIHNNEHIGVLEFGIKLNYFTKLLSENHNIIHAHFVKTDQLEVLTIQKEYEKKGEYSIVFRDNLFRQFIDKIDINKDEQIIQKNGKTYLVCTLNLKDYENKVVSKILVVEDVSKIVKKNNIWFQFVNFISIVVFIFMIILIYILLQKFSKEIQIHLKTITKLHRKSKYLQNKANTDELTKLYNKRYFDKYLEQYLEDDKKGCLLFIDLDYFKNINDEYGHSIGDQVLKNFATVVRKNLREIDLFARWGGEEFIILLEGVSVEQGHKKAETIRELVASTPIYENINITISIGMACIDDGVDKDKLIKQADTHLYKSKNQGRNCISF